VGRSAQFRGALHRDIRGIHRHRPAPKDVVPGQRTRAGHKFPSRSARGRSAAPPIGRTGLPTFVDGLRAVQITDAVLRSAETHRWVDVELGEAPAAARTERVS
jgi:hypothetical protein